jgi:hypothetical protein
LRPISIFALAMFSSLALAGVEEDVKALQS